MLHCLKRADDAAELFTLQRVCDGLIQHVLGCAQGVGGKYDAPGIYNIGTYLGIVAAG